MQKIIDNFLLTILYFEVLANSGVLERYLNAEKSSMVRSVFAKMWGLGDNENNSSEIIKVGQKVVAAVYHKSDSFRMPSKIPETMC